MADPSRKNSGLATTVTRLPLRHSATNSSHVPGNTVLRMMMVWLGRKWTRSDARQRMRERCSVAELAQTGLGGRVICEERDLLYEEAPAAYKNIEAVIGDLVDAGLVSVIATFRPLLTYKTRKPRR